MRWNVSNMRGALKSPMRSRAESHDESSGTIARSALRSTSEAHLHRSLAHRQKRSSGITTGTRRARAIQLPRWAASDGVAVLGWLGWLARLGRIVLCL